MDQFECLDVIDVRGPEALAFLQSQFAADLNTVADGQLRWAALLNAQGRVLHVVGAWRAAVDQWWLLVPFGRGDELFGALKAMVFRRKVKVERRAELHVVADAGGVDLGFASLRVALGADSAGAVWNLELCDAAVEAGLVWIDAGAVGKHLAHSLQLQRFDAFSVKKGCYPGQEIVARTHFLGRNKRVLVRLRSPGAGSWQVGDTVYNGDVAVGEVASSGRVAALAVLTNSPGPDDSIQVGADRSKVMVVEGISDAV